MGTYSNGRNYCLCCGARAEPYGWASIDSDGSSKSCSKEVCVMCLESGCKGKDGKGCFGSKLAQPAYEYHDGCGCKKEKK